MIDEWTKHEEAVLSDYIQVLEALQLKSEQPLTQCTTLSKGLKALFGAYISICGRQDSGTQLKTVNNDLLVPWL